MCCYFDDLKMSIAGRAACVCVLDGVREREREKKKERNKTRLVEMENDHFADRANDTGAIYG